jgi:hypothetical protein
MATRSIVTSQPDVACDVCGRRLLRGELPDIFLAGGQRRTVCELCAPRAAHEGWLREADRHSVSLPPSRSRRGRNLFDRLRPQREAVSDRSMEEGFAGEGLPLGSPGVVAGYQTESYDFLDAIASVPEDPSTAPAALNNEDSVSTQQPDSAPPPTLTAGELKVERALEVFNAGEHPRRVAGVARSLGEPSVAARPLAESGSVVSIVVAWELSWYRYEVDLGDEAAGAMVAAQGTELGELAEEDQLVNATADEHGALRSLRV